MRSLATWSPSNLPREQHCKPPAEASCCSLAPWKPRMPYPSLGRFFVIATMTVSKDWCRCAFVGVGVRQWPWKPVGKKMADESDCQVFALSTRGKEKVSFLSYAELLIHCCFYFLICDPDVQPGGLCSLQVLAVAQDFTRQSKSLYPKVNHM